MFLFLELGQNPSGAKEQAIITAGSDNMGKGKQFDKISKQILTASRLRLSCSCLRKSALLVAALS